MDMKGVCFPVYGFSKVSDTGEHLRPLGQKTSLDEKTTGRAEAGKE